MAAAAIVAVAAGWWRRHADDSSAEPLRGSGAVRHVPCRDRVELREDGDGAVVL